MGEKTKRCVIFGGAAIGNYQVLRTALRTDDYMIFCDSGLKHSEALGIPPDLIIGDFDSHENPHLPAETIILPHEKDDTDTAFAVKEALRRGFTDFLLCGAIGARMDHTLVNVSMLFLIEKAGAHALIRDDYEEMELISEGCGAYIPDSYPYFSLVTLNGPAEGVSISGALYNLDNAHIDVLDPYATSNEVLPGETAHVTVQSGTLLLIKVLEAV